MADNANPKQKLTKLLESLRAATALGRLTWVEAIGERTFRTILENAMIRVSASYRYNNEPDDLVYVLDLIDNDGNMIDSFDIDSQSLDQWKIAEDLYSRVRRAARHSDEFLDQVIAAVESKVS